MSGVQFSPAFSGLFFFFIYGYFSFSLEYYAVLGIDRRFTTKGLMYSFPFVLFYLFAILRIVFSILLLSGIPCRPVFLSFDVKLLIQIHFFHVYFFFKPPFRILKNHLLTKGLSNSQCGLGKSPSGLELFLQPQSALSLCSSCFVSWVTGTTGVYHQVWKYLHALWQWNDGKAKAFSPRHASGSQLYSPRLVTAVYFLLECWAATEPHLGQPQATGWKPIATL